MNRRDFLKTSGVLAACGLIPLGVSGWAARAWAMAPRRRLIVIFLRGAVDGLSVVVPYQEAAYYAMRPHIAIPRPGQPLGALDLDGRFGLHPELASLMPLWHQGTLAFVHACGSPSANRSHFDAQDFMETGTPDVKRTPDGWMNRLLGVLPGPHSPTQALGFGETLPRILSGPNEVANMPLGRAAAKLLPIDRPRINTAFERLYHGSDALSVAYQEGQMARQELLDDFDAIDAERMMADNGAPSPFGFAEDTRQLARLIAEDSSIQLAFLAVGGWDTHVNQGASKGQLAGHLKPLAEGLASLARGLGSAYAETTILVMSEFGRTAHENGDAGTDHGHGNVMTVLGGTVQGGKVYGRWPGLETEQLFQQRDLAVTTDFRDVIGAVLEHHLGLERHQQDRVLPGAPRTADLQGLIRVTPMACSRQESGSGCSAAWRP